MPYKSKLFRRNVVAVKSAPTSAKAVAYKASRRVTGLRRAINSMIERHHLDTNLTSGFGSGGISTTGSVLELSQIPQGDTEVMRSGIQVTPQSMKVDLQLNTPTGALPDAYNKLRVLIFRWYDTTTPAVGDILNGTGFTNFIQAPYNWVQGRSKYKMLHDSKTLITNTDRPVAFLRKTFKFSQYDKIRFSGSSASSGEWGRIYMLICSDSSAIPHPTPTGYTRLVFKDL